MPACTANLTNVSTFVSFFSTLSLWKPKWNSRLLEAFKIDYVGTDPYVSCAPSLCHHRVGSQDKFLVLSSDGLYQYFTNKEVVDQVVEALTAAEPDGDPAQHLVGELVHRAARKAGEQPVHPTVHEHARARHTDRHAWTPGL
jgi:hypothetical protein